MLRTTAPGNDGNRYTEGNPGLGQPATTVSASAMNFHQEELANAVLRAGITLASDEDQLADAMETIAAKGGAQISSTITNNQSSAGDLTGLLFDKTTIKAARILYSIERSDDNPTTVSQVGELMVVHDSVNDVWRINDTAVLDDAGVTFSILTTGQVQYTSTNFTGGSYASAFRATITQLNL